MLNTAERFELLRTIRFWCKVGSLPAKIDLSTWEIHPHAKKRTTWKCYCRMFLFALHAIYKLVALVYWLKVGMPLHQAVVHAVLAACMVVVTYWYYVLYIKYPRLFGTYLKMTLTGNDGYHTLVDSQNIRSWSRCLTECTLQDIFAMTVTYMVPIAMLAIMLTFISNPSMKYLLYAALPKEHQTWIKFGILLLEELRVLSVICSVAIPLLIIQVISFDLVRTKLQLLDDSMQRAALFRRYGHIYKSLRLTQMYVNITNLINCYLIFSVKTLSIGISIGTGYAAIAHFDVYPVFGVMFYLIFLNSTLIYVACYDKAFKIPGLFHRVTQRAMLVEHRDTAEASKIFKRQMQSFPRVGIKVGEFRMMERESTINFIDFVLTNIVSLLVAYG